MYGSGLLVKFSLRGWQFYLASVQMSEPARKKRKEESARKMKTVLSASHGFATRNNNIYIYIYAKQ